MYNSNSTYFMQSCTVPDWKFCPRCGRPFGDGWNYCPGCGGARALQSYGTPYWNGGMIGGTASGMIGGTVTTTTDAATISNTYKVKDYQAAVDAAFKQAEAAKHGGA